MCDQCPVFHLNTKEKAMDYPNEEEIKPKTATETKVGKRF